MLRLSVSTSIGYWAGYWLLYFRAGLCLPKAKPWFSFQDFYERRLYDDLMGALGGALRAISR